MSLAASNSSLWTDLLSVIGYGLAAGVGITVVFSIALRGVITAATARRGGHPAAALAWGAVGAVGIALCLAAVVAAVVVMRAR